MKRIFIIGVIVAISMGGQVALAAPNLSDNTGGDPNLSDNTGGDPNLSDNTGGDPNLSDNTGGQHQANGARYVRDYDKIQTAQQLANELETCASTNCDRLDSLVQQCRQLLSELRASQVTPPRGNPSARPW